MAPMRFAFGPFELDTSQGILFEHGQPVPMGGKALAILRTLLEAHGQVVAKSALMDAAWPATTVEESNLTVQIANLRKQLRGTVDSEDWIATFPGSATASPASSRSLGARNQTPYRQSNRGKASSGCVFGQRSSALLSCLSSPLASSDGCSPMGRVERQPPSSAWRCPCRIGRRLRCCHSST